MYHLVSLMATQIKILPHSIKTILKIIPSCRLHEDSTKGQNYYK